MSQIAGPYGLVLRKYLGETPFSSGMHSYVLSANQTSGYYFGDPVGLVAGQPVPITATPVAGTLSANSPIGIFYGCEFQDPIRGFVNAQYLAPNAISNGALNVKLKIVDYPWAVMQVQADGPITYAQVGMNAALQHFATGNAAGNSTVSLVSASVGAAAAAVRIFDLVVNAAPSPGASSMPGDPFTDCLVVWCPTAHRFSLAAGQ